MSCKHFHKSKSVKISSGEVVVSFVNPPLEVANCEPFCFAICQCIPSGVEGLPVSLEINGTTVPLWNKFGNVVTGDKLKTRFRYRGYFGRDTDLHVIAINTPSTRCAMVCH